MRDTSCGRGQIRDTAPPCTHTSVDHVVADVFSDVIAGPQCSHVITLPSTRPSPTRPLLPPVTTTHAGRNRTAGQAARAGSALLLRAPDATHIRFPATALLEPCIPLPATALRLAVTLHPLPATTLLQPCIHSPLQPCYPLAPVSCHLLTRMSAVAVFSVMHSSGPESVRMLWTTPATAQHPRPATALHPRPAAALHLPRPQLQPCIFPATAMHPRPATALHPPRTSETHELTACEGESSRE